MTASSIRLAATTAALALVVACGAEGPRGLSAEQAELLAGARFANYDKGRARFEAQVPLPDGSTGTLAGDVDWRRHVGRAVLSGRTEVVWGPEKIQVRPLSAAAPPVVRRADPEASPLDRALLMILQLGATRPENPQLLIQNQATWIRSDRVAEVPVQVFRGPATRDTAPGHQRTYYWLDADGLLRRFEARLSDSAPPLTVDLHH